MRVISLFGLLALTTVFIPSAAAQEHSDHPQCSFEGTWYADAGFTTRIDAQRHWATWSGDSTQGSPASQGWVVTDGPFMTFDNDGAEGGFDYIWSFDDDCSVLDLRLVRRRGEPDESGYRLRFNRISE